MADALRTTWRDRPSLSDAPSGPCRAAVACESIGSTGCYSRRPVRRFVCKDIGSGAVPARRVRNVFHDRGFADVFLRHLKQTEGRKHMTMNREQCDIQLQGCQLGHMLPEHPNTSWPVAEDIVCSPYVSAWKSGLRSAHEAWMAPRRSPWVSAGATRGRP